MKEEKITFEIMDYPLGKFTNAELYYIISDLLCLGGLGSGLIEREKLFLCFDSSLPDDITEIKFFFISTLPVISKEMIGPETTIVLGRIMDGFDEIEYHCVRQISSDVDPDMVTFNAKEISKTLSKAMIPKMRPLNLVNGLAKISNQTDISSRETNPLFLLNKDSPLEPGIRHQFDFGILQGVEYSGHYYLIVQPPKENESNSNEVIDFTIVDNEDEDFYPHYIQYKVNLHYRQITDDNITDFENGASCLLPLPLDEPKTN